MQGLTLAVTYVVFVTIGLAIAVGIGLMTDRINAPISLLVFFGSAAFFTAFAWPVAVRLTEPAAEPVRVRVQTK
jgi:hypothetical protein